jgi:hypothetical protein
MGPETGAAAVDPDLAEDFPAFFGGKNIWTLVVRALIHAEAGTNSFV